jgi:DNA-binding transcriptional MerR regulator
MYYLESLYHAQQSIEFFHFCRAHLDSNPYELVDMIAKSKFAPMFGIANAADQIQFCKAMCAECNKEMTDQEFIEWAMVNHPRAKKPLIQWMDRGRLRTGVTLESVRKQIEDRRAAEGKDEASLVQFLAENHALWVRIKESKITTHAEFTGFIDKRFPPGQFRAVIKDGGPEFSARFMKAIRDGIVPEPAATVDQLEQWQTAVSKLVDDNRQAESIEAIERFRDAIKDKAKSSGNMQELTDVASKVIQFHEDRKDLLKPQEQ